LDKVKDLVYDPVVSRYGGDEGIPQLQDALVQKVTSIKLNCLNSEVL